MGYPRKAEAAPGPFHLLAILSARHGGMSLPELARRTRYAASSIARWDEKWSGQGEDFERLMRLDPQTARDYSFDSLFPDHSAQGTFEISQTPPPTTEAPEPLPAGDLQ